MNAGPTPAVAVLGLGEAGSAFASGLASAGAPVRGFDPAVEAPTGIGAANSDADACTGADLVLSLTTAAQAQAALHQSLPALTAGAVYADANTAAAGLKQRLAAAAAEAGVLFADIAIMAPIPGNGYQVPLVASGTGAHQAADILAGYGATIEVLPGPAGLAATRKLLRSVFYKGMSTAIIEALLGARAAGCEDWLREHIAAELTAADAATLTRMESGSYQHAVRRSHEMAAATELLADLGVPPRIAHASQLWLEHLARGQRG